MNVFQYLLHAWRLERNRRQMWRNRTVYTYTPRPDQRSTLSWWRNAWRS